MRSLQMDDVFAAGRVLTKIGVREEIADVIKRAEENKIKKIRMDMGVDMFLGILEKAMQENAENEIYKFIARLFECEPEEVRVMKPTQVLEDLLKVANVEEWKSFFVYLRKLIMKK